ncbi:aspartate aminotransferase family protein [Pelomicrobium sp.]|uniref:aspartate aminotransferase family protein n=1 Tax=Pelomicrobium sp. TaxID=2815319 RepID=UPI002FDD3422
MSQYLMDTYARLPVAFTRGEGVWLWDAEGRRYLDAVAGVAVCGIGHAHPRLAEALCRQAQTLIHTSNLYRIPLQEELAARLCSLSGMDNAFFCNSGAEANEAAIKLARLYGHRRGIETPTIIVMERAFHGRTMATLTATGNRKVQAGFEPLLGGFARVPYNDVRAVEQVGEHNRDVVAVLVEPFQGEGGVQVPEATYLERLRAVCDRFGWLLMLDEVQCGIGRTGRWFAFQHTRMHPDVMTLAKGLGSGFPVGACLARGAAAQVFKPGTHGSTFGGGPLACTAALTTLAVMEEEGLLANAASMGHYMLQAFRERLGGVPGVVEVRGQGLMIGIELKRPCKELVERALAAGVLINVTLDSVIRLLPPLVIDRTQAQQVVDTVVAVVTEFLRDEAREAAS